MSNWVLGVVIGFFIGSLITQTIAVVKYEKQKPHEYVQKSATIEMLNDLDEKGWDCEYWTGSYDDEHDPTWITISANCEREKK